MRIMLPSLYLIYHLHCAKTYTSKRLLTILWYTICERHYFLLVVHSYFKAPYLKFAPNAHHGCASTFYSKKYKHQTQIFRFGYHIWKFVPNNVYRILLLLQLIRLDHDSDIKRKVFKAWQQCDAWLKYTAKREYVFLLWISTEEMLK